MIWGTVVGIASDAVVSSGYGLGYWLAVPTALLSLLFDGDLESGCSGVSRLGPLSLSASGTWQCASRIERTAEKRAPNEW